MIVRHEKSDDIETISKLTTQAFAGVPYSDGSEAAIILRLRAAGALHLSQVAEDMGKIVGHVAFSPLVGPDGWFALGPIAVEPTRQKQGIGSLLIRNSIDLLRQQGARGCAVLGDGAYYQRFGFVSAAQWAPDGIPAEHFMLLCIDGQWPSEPLAFHPAFGGPEGEAGVNTASAP